MSMINAIVKSLSSMSSADLMTLAHKSGVSYFTIQKIKSGETKNPLMKTCEALSKAIKK